MAILVLTSASGSPGTTTLGVGLALTWPRPVLLVDADPGAHQAVLAGFLTGQSAAGRGLLRVAEAHRDGRRLREVIMDQTLPLAVDPEQSRRFLPGFTRPGSAGLFGGVWPDLVGALAELDDVGMDVILDTGRLGASGLPGAVVAAAGLIGLVLRADLRSVVSAQVHLPILSLDTEGAPDPRYGLLVVGPGRPYGAGEIGRALGLSVLAGVPFDAGSAAHLCDGAPRPRRFETSTLNRGLQFAATTLYGRLQDRARVIGARG